jgi:chloramphenicol 3-O-phosphotransferase
MKPLVMLSGPLAAGKSSVARELVALAPAPIAYIEGDLFWKFIPKLTRSNRRDDDFKMVMRAMMSAGSHYAVAGYETIVDFTIPPWFINTAKAVAKFRGIPLDFVVVKPSMAVCAARAAARAECPVADYSPYRDLYESFEDARDFAIEDDDGDPAAIAARIREGLDSGLYRIE